MPTAQVFNAEGKSTGTVELPGAVFGVKPHTAVIHEVLIAQLANRRAGTHATKTRGEVAGSTRKIWRQKGTGRARHGSRKAPLFIGGGITFGPKPADYRQQTPKKVRQLAVRSALSAKAAAGQIIVLDPPVLEAPRTQLIAQLLERLQAVKPSQPGQEARPVGSKTLIVTPAHDAMLMRSAANLPQVTVRPATSLRLHDILTADRVIFTAPAVAVVAEVFVR